MGTRNVSLSERYDRFIDERVASGRCHNASEVVRAALALLERRELQDALKLEALRRAAAEGFSELDQGSGILLEDNEALGTLLDDIEARVHRGECRISWSSPSLRACRTRPHVSPAVQP